MTPLSIVQFDGNACKACRANTLAKVTQEETEEKQALQLKGNAQAFRGMPGDGPDIDLEDETKLQWTGSAQEIVISMLIDGFNQNKTHPILDPNL